MVEEILTTTEISQIEPNPVRTSNPSFLVTLKDGTECVWKFSGPRWRKEVAAFKVSTFLKFDLVPVTVCRVIDGRRGSLSRYVPSVRLERRNVIVKGRFGLECQTVLANQIPRRELQKQKLFDFIIDCEDRGRFKNWLLTPDVKILCIDHEHAFRARNYILVPDASHFEFLSMRENQKIKDSILDGSNVLSLEKELLPLIGRVRTDLFLGRLHSLKR